MIHLCIPFWLFTLQIPLCLYLALFCGVMLPASQAMLLLLHGATRPAIIVLLAATDANRHPPSLHAAI
jgi:hypothetical protein